MVSLPVQFQGQRELGRIEALGPSAHAAACTRREQPGLRALADQIALELGQCAEQVEDQLAAARCGVDVLLKAAQPDLGGL